MAGVMPPADLTWQAHAAANLLEAKKKRGRIGTKKSRTGCITCKARRTKCDENRPTCKKCSISGRQCSYDPREQHERKGTAFLGRQLSDSIGLREKDKRTFEYFLSWTAPRLAGTLDFDFWCGQVLVLARSETVVLDALLALSVLYEHPQFMKSFSTSGEDYPTPQDHPTFASHFGRPIDSYHSLALQHYNRSMHTLQEQIASEKVSPTLAIVSCLLYIAIETIRDNVFAARALLTHGAQMARAFSSKSVHLAEELQQSFTQTMVRLGVLAATYGYLEPLRILGTGLVRSQIECFTTVADARNALYDIMADAQQCLPEQLDHASRTPSCVQDMEISGVDDAPLVADVVPARFMDDSTPDRTSDSSKPLRENAPNAENPFDVWGKMESTTSRPTAEPSRAKQGDLQRRLTQWRAQFKQLSSPPEDETACNLLMLYHVSWIAISTWLSTHQTSFDSYTYNFSEIVRIARKYQEIKNSQNSTFSMETGAVGPLFYVATKCRLPSLRRTAIDLMPRGTKKESMFCAKSTSEVAKRILAIEEEGLSLPINDTVLPLEENRINGFEILIHRPAHRQELRVTRFLPGRDGSRMKFVKDYPI